MLEESFIGITEDRMKHILGVSRLCYSISKNKGLSEEECIKMFLIGYLHDVGYEFSTKSEEHGKIGYEMLKTIGVDLKEVLNHGDPNIKQNKYLEILNIADQHINSRGEYVNCCDRLTDIKNRYGRNSSQYINFFLLNEKLFN